VCWSHLGFVSFWIVCSLLTVFMGIVSPVPGKPANSGMEVLVQGKQSKAVVDYLLGKGVPKNWIKAPVTPKK
jgi:hypothetical protein